MSFIFTKIPQGKSVKDEMPFLLNDIALDGKKEMLHRVKKNDEVESVNVLTKQKKKNKITDVELLPKKGYFVLINRNLPFHRYQSMVLADGRVVHAQQLKLGDVLIDEFGGEVGVCDVRRVKGDFDFYKLAVDGDHTYILNGILVHNASRYWVGGTANWDGTAGTKWAASSGGAGGSSVPTTADDVFFTNLSTGTCTISTGNTGCLSLDFNGFAGTIAGTAGLTVAGVTFRLASGMTHSYTGTYTFTSTGTNTLTFATKTTGCTYNFNGTGGTWTVQDTWNNGSSAITVTAGTLNTNGFTVTCGTLTANGSGRTLTLGASTINLQSYAGSSGMTLNAGTSTIALSGSANSGTIFAGGGKTFNIVTLTSTHSTNALAMSGANTFATLTITGAAAMGQVWQFAANQTVTGTLTINGNSATNRLFIRSDTLGTARTLSAATTTLTNIDFMDITGSGAAGWTGTSLANGGGNSGITFTAAVTRYAVASGSWSSTAMWSATSGGAGGQSVPLIHDTVFLNASSAAGTYTVNMPRVAGFDSTGFTRTLTTSTTAMVFGSIILGTGLTLTASVQTYTLMGRGSHTLDGGGKTWSKQFVMDSVGGTYTLVGNFTTNTSFTLTRGTLSLSSFTLSCASFSSSNSNTRTIAFGTGIIDCTSPSLTSLFTISTATNLTVTGQTTGLIRSSGNNAVGVQMSGNASVQLPSISKTAGTSTFTIFNVDCHDLNFTGYSGTFSHSGTLTIRGSLTVSTGMSWSASNDTVQFLAPSGTETVQPNGKTFDFPVTVNASGAIIQLSGNLTMGTTRTFTLTAGTIDLNDFDLTCNSFSSSNSNTRGIDFGNGDIILTGNNATIWTTSTNTNLTITLGGTGRVICNYSGATGTRTITTGTLTEAKTVPFSITAGTDTVTFTAATTSYTRGMDFTGFSGTLTNGQKFVYGSVILSSTMTLGAGSSTITFLFTSGTYQFTTNGITMTHSVSVQVSGAVLQLGSDLTMATGTQFNINNGEFDANDFNITAPYIVGTSSGSTWRMGSGTWELTGQGFAPFGFNTTVIPETSTVKFTASSGIQYVSYGSGVAMPLWNLWNAQTGTAYLQIQSYTYTYTFNTITLDAGTETRFDQDGIFQYESLVALGTVSDGIIIRSISITTQTTLDNAGTADTVVEYCTISDVLATSTAGFRNYSLLTDNNVDGGNNNGWIFATGVPSVGTTLMTQAGATSATVDGVLYSDNGFSVTRRGFVLDLAPQSDPGNTNPSSSAYAIVVDETGTWVSGDISLLATPLSANTRYYYRAFAQNSSGYSYGAELSFFTVTYSITTWQHLNAMRYDTDGVFTLAGNLDQYSTGYDTYASSLANGGLGWVPIYGLAGFDGSLDGQNYRIRGLYISEGSGNGVGLFAQVNATGSLDNIRLVDVVMEYFTGWDYVGSLVGNCDAPVTNCHVFGVTISPDGYSYGCGGLIGQQTGADIYRCSARDVLILSDGVLGVTTSTGGLVGASQEYSIEECFATGELSCDDYGGGLVGERYGFATGHVIKNCYARTNVYETLYLDGNNHGGFGGYLETDETQKCYSTGEVTSSDVSELGGFTASSYSPSQDNFWDTDTSGLVVDNPNGSGTIATGKTTAQMKTITTYTSVGGGLTEAWDIVASRNTANIWGMLATINDGYPFLQNLPVSVYATPMVETVVVNDNVSFLRTASLILTDTITLVDTVLAEKLSTAWEIALDEVITITDTVNRSIGRALDEIVTIVDSVSVAKITSVAFNEVVTIVDNISRSVGKALVETVTLVDTVSRSVGRFLTETISVTDTIDTLRAKFIALDETITVVDSLFRSIGRALDEVITVTDTFVKSLFKTVSLDEVVTIVDTFNKSFLLTLNETIEILDSVAKSTSRAFTETITVVDSVAKTVGRSLAETIVVVDSVRRSIGKVLDETVTVTDSLVRSIGRSLTESIVVSDILTFLKAARGYILGYDNDTNTGIGKRSGAILGRDNDTNTGIGKRSTPQVGRDNDTNTGIGKKLH